MGNKRSRIRTVLLAAAAAALLAALSTTGASPVSAAPPPTFVAQGSAEQVYVTGLGAGDSASLVDSGGTTVATQTANPLGGMLFRNVTPGSGYRVKDVTSGSESAPVTVHTNADAPWNPEIYNQPINDNGYQYLTTRDGTQLALMVHLPPGKSAPYPTVIEYSGYGYANPDGPQSGLAPLANIMGFAVVDVNIRGTGCSGGAFDFFERLQLLDGYDVIETIAHQPWVLNNKVGMFGLSYGGISQVFTAQTNPPSLAAIAPMSVMDSSASLIAPGGILNTGFTLGWVQGRDDDAKPAGPKTGQDWAYKRIKNGDTTCATNQELHGEATNFVAKARANLFYVPAVADPLDPVTFVDKIHMPVFMTCQWQDEQTGGHCPALVQHMTGTTKKWFTFTNGAHIDSIDPATFTRMFDFLQLYVAKRAPKDDNALMRGVAPLIYQIAMGIPADGTITLPDDPIQDEPTYASALAAFEKLPEVRVRFENGAGTSPGGDTTPGNPYAAFEHSFSTLPIPGTQARTWYLGPNGTLAAHPPSNGHIDSYTSDASALPLTDYGDDTGTGGLWGNASQWDWNWLQNPAGNAVSYVTDPMTQDTTIIGSGGVHLWVKSSTPDVDLQATISEVRPDGVETFVQNGWMRASKRKLSSGSDNLFKIPSTSLRPIPSFTLADAAPMPADQFAEVSIPLYYQGHAYRTGSRIRVTIAAPNGANPVWSFRETEPEDSTAEVSLKYSASMPSSLVLPVVPGLEIPTPLPACPSLRNQPCREFQPYTNRSIALPPDTTTTTTTSTTSTTSTSTTSTTSTTVPNVVAPGVAVPPAAGHGAAPVSLSTPQSTGYLALTGAGLWRLLAAAAFLVLAGFGLIRVVRIRRS